MFRLSVVLIAGVSFIQIGCATEQTLYKGKTSGEWDQIARNDIDPDSRREASSALEAIAAHDAGTQPELSERQNAMFFGVSIASIAMIAVLAMIVTFPMLERERRKIPKTTPMTPPSPIFRRREYLASLSPEEYASLELISANEN